jgi:ubiquinone/menaquinone biosynthesis C-methylase UbiE
MDSHTYHLEELSIAGDPDDPRRVMPPVGENHQRILDVGCGAGQTLIASRLGPETVAVGVDVHHPTLSLGKRLNGDIQFVCGKGEALPFKDESFDLIISRVAVPYMQALSAIREMSRVLKAGGDLWVVLHPFRMVVREMVKDLARLRLRRALYQAYVMVNGLALHLFNKEFHMPLRRGRYESFQTSSGMRRNLRDAGFESIKISDDKFFVVTAKKSGGRETARAGARVAG